MSKPTGKLYQMLEITREAISSEIKASYRRIALVHHPDKNPDNPNSTVIFQQLQAAYEILTD